MIENNMNKIPDAVRKYFAMQGRKGGKLGSREAKSRAGKLGHAQMVKNLAAKMAPLPEQEQPQEKNK